MVKNLNIMLEKGKGPVLGKLRTTQLVESNFQLLIIIFVNERMVGVIETDERISKGNCRSRKGHSIDDLMLKKDYHAIAACKAWRK